MCHFLLTEIDICLVQKLDTDYTLENSDQT